jgi:hypothetical protein
VAGVSSGSARHEGECKGGDEDAEAGQPQLLTGHDAVG